MKTIKALKKHAWKPKPVFLFGFELEGGYPTGQDYLFNQLLKSVYGKQVETSEDWSVNFNNSFNSIEIKTPPLPENTAIKKFFILIEKLKEFGFVTNQSCGLHVNISEKKLFQFNTLENPVVKKLCWNFGNKFPVSVWRRAFKRQRNSYCEWTKNHQKYFKRSWKSIHCMAKDRSIERGAIFIDKVNLNNPKNRRIEIRVAGNSNYHSNKELLLNYINTIREHMYVAYDKAFET